MTMVSHQLPSCHYCNRKEKKAPLATLDHSAAAFL